MKQNKKFEVGMVDQNKRRKDRDNLAAVIASVLGIPLSQSFHCPFDDDDEGWEFKLAEWCGELGIHHVKADPETERPKGLHAIYGQSPRGTQHAVVGRNGVQVHDPHPSRAGLKHVKDYGIFIPFGSRVKDYITILTET